jgi:hypothetical protein
LTKCYLLRSSGVWIIIALIDAERIAAEKGIVMPITVALSNAKGSVLARADKLCSIDRDL